MLLLRETNGACLDKRSVEQTGDIIFFFFFLHRLSGVLSLAGDKQTQSV